MKRFFGALVAVSCLTPFLATGARAEVIVNNFFSPFTTIEVAPGYYGHRRHADGYYLHNPNYNSRCHYRWHAYYGEWRVNCYRMNYGRGEYWGGEGYWGRRDYWD